MKLFFRLKQLRKQLNYSQIEFSNILKIANSTYQYYERGERAIPSDVLEKIITTFKVNPAWLLTGEGEMFLDKQKEGSPIQGYSAHPEPSNDEFVAIPLFSGYISAGSGRLPDNSIEAYLSFRKDWIKRKGDYKNMSLVRIVGDSMEPTLHAGDIVLIDHTKNYISGNSIYAISIDDEIFIKRLQLISKTQIQVISDNNKYPPYITHPDNLKINGKALWFAHEIPD